MVRLTGTANSLHDRQVAAEVAWAAPGTIDVRTFLPLFERAKIRVFANR